MSRVANWRTVFWIGLACVAAVLLLAIWFFTTYEQVPDTRFERVGREARANPYLALGRFGALLNRPVRVLEDPEQLDALAGRGVLLLDRQRRRMVPLARAENLLKWVAAGGYLIVAAESDLQQDFILQRLALKPVLPEKKSLGDTDDEAEPVPPPKLPKTFPLRLPGSERALEIQTGHDSLMLKAGTLAPLWQAGPGPGHAHVLHFGWGRGQITVFQSFAPFTNWNIGEDDHAELLSSLLDRYQPKGPVWLAARLKMPSLWQWLQENAFAALLSAAALIVFWLWRIVPRFGGLRRLPEPERRGLKDHLAAMGRGVWKSGGLSDWLAVVRRACHARIAQRHPQLTRQTPEQRAASLQNLTGIDAARIHHALESPYLTSQKDFTHAVQTLQELSRKI